MHLYFNFLTTWINNDGNTAKQAGLRSRDCPPPAGGMCAPLWRGPCPHGALFSQLLGLRGVGSCRCPLYLILVSGTWLCFPGWACRCCGWSLLPQAHCCAHLFPCVSLHQTGSPWRLELSLLICFTSTAFAFELDALLLRGYRWPPDFRPRALFGPLRVNSNWNECVATVLGLFHHPGPCRYLTLWP